MRRAIIPLILVTLAILLYLPSCQVGFIFDDYFHLAVLETRSADELPAAGLWSWVDDSAPPLLDDPVQGDFLPWWARDDLRILFFRPLPSWLHGLDFQLHGRQVAGWHATQLLLWGLVVTAVLGLYAELCRHAGLGRGVAMLAGLIFVVDECHAWNVTWIATRHSLVAVLFTALALLAYLRFRRCGGVGHLVLASLSFVLALLSSEVAIVLVGWVALYELILADSPWPERLRSAAPILGLAGLYLAGYVGSGFGTRNSGWYLDPTADPVGFGQALLTERLPALLHGLLTPIPAELGPVFGSRSLLFAGFSLAILVLTVLVVHGHHRPVWRFVAVATLVSMLPVAAAVPINYLLLLPSVGFAWLLAVVLHDVVRRLRDPGAVSRWRRAGWLVVTVVLVLFHLVLAPLSAYASIGVLARTHERPARTLLEAQMPPPGAAASRARVLVLSLPSPLLSSYLPVSVLLLEPAARPAAIWNLSSLAEPPAVTRIDSRTFDLEIPPPGLLGGLWDRTVHDGKNLRTGQTFRRGVLSAEILAVEGPTISKARFRLDLELDHEDVWLLYWNGERLARFEPPPIGVTQSPRLLRDSGP